MCRCVSGIYHSERIAKKRVPVDGMQHFFGAKGAQLTVVEVPGSKIGDDLRHASLYGETHNVGRIFLRCEELFKGAFGEKIGTLCGIHIDIKILWCLCR